MPASLCIITDTKLNFAIKLCAVRKCSALQETWFYTNLAGNPLIVRFLLKSKTCNTYLYPPFPLCDLEISIFWCFVLALEPISDALLEGKKSVSVYVCIS